LISNVFPGVAEVFANFLLLVSMLIKLDLPTLERPIKAYSGAWVEGHFPTEELLMTNSADLISMSVCIFLLANIRFLFGFWLSLHKFMYFDCR
jgi:hypothetical protein